MTTGERATAHHDGSPAQAFLFARQLAAYEIAATMLTHKDNVLDLACGTGYGTAVISRSVASVVGVDASAAAIALCKMRYAESGCRFLVADGTRLPLRNAEFSATVSFQTIEHVRDDASFVAELRRVTADGGLCLITTPNRELRLKPGQRPWNRFHVREYDASELRRLLQTVFTRVDVGGVHASAVWTEFERERIQSAQRIARLDPLCLRHRVPAGVVSLMRRIVAGRPSGPQSGALPTAPAVSTADFRLDQQAEQAMDLFAVCR